MKWLMLADEIKRIEAVLGAQVAASDIASATHAIEPMRMGRGGVATIQISGPLLNKRSGLLDYFGVTYSTYPDIRLQIDEAKERGAKRIDFDVNSPGGTVDGLYETMGSVRDAGVKTRAVAGSTMASAAYMLASQTGEVIAANDLSLIGSIGVALDTDVFGWERSVVNTDSPKKRPNIDTDEGQAVIREELDDIYQVLAEKIAIGRGVSPEVVKRDYGQGAMMTARQAKQRGLIDSIGVVTNKPTANPAANQGDKLMNAKQLKEEHRAVYDEIFALGAESGVKAERERVEAHLVLAEGSGDFDTAHQAIKDGEEMTSLVMAKHQSAAMKRDMVAARQADNPDEIDATVKPTDDIQATKAGLEAGCDGLVWEPMEVM